VEDALSNFARRVIRKPNSKSREHGRIVRREQAAVILRLEELLVLSVPRRVIHERAFGVPIVSPPRIPKESHSGPLGLTSDLS
jgi:hypothetical protein